MEIKLEMKITPDIIAAINRATDYYGNVSQVAKNMGVAHSTVLFWLSGKTTSISGHLWAGKIRPVLAPFLDPARLDQMVPISMRDNTFPEYHLNSNKANKESQNPGEKNADMHLAKILSFQDLMQLDPALDPIDEYVNNHCCGTTYFVKKIQSGFFAIKIDKKYAGYFPVNTELLVAAAQYPKKGDIVIARIHGQNDLILGKYNRIDDKITLKPLNGEKTLSWDCRVNKGFLDWLYPLLEARIDLSQDDSEAFL